MGTCCDVSEEKLSEFVEEPHLDGAVLKVLIAQILASLVSVGEVGSRVGDDRLVLIERSEERIGGKCYHSECLSVTGLLCVTQRICIHES